MKTFAIAILSAALLHTATAQQSFLPQPTRSQSGQFVCYGVPEGDQRYLSRTNLATDANLVELEPGMLAVSCERVRQELWRELGFNGNIVGKIFIFLHHARSTDDSILITPQPFTDVWNYRIDLPDVADRTHYMSALTHVILLDIANRRATTHSAEIPVWLREGFAQQLLASPELGLIPPIVQWNSKGIAYTSVQMDGYLTNALTRSHDLLHSNPAMTIDELSWPSDADLQGGRGAQFRGSSQLFVARLQNLQNGRASLLSFIESLPLYYNWQLAFLNVYHDEFASMLAVEKWWAVNLVEFTGRDLAQTWTLEESWRKLDAALHPNVEVRASKNQLPLHGTVTLQTVIRDWKSSQQSSTLTTIVKQLALLDPRLSPEVRLLAANYRATLLKYMNDRDKIESMPSIKSRPKPSTAPLVRQTLITLDSFDKQRATARPNILATTKLESQTNTVP